MDKLTYAERKLLRALIIRWPSGHGFATVYNARKNYPNLNIYKGLQAKGKLTITDSHNVTTENMLYGMTSINFILK